MAWRVGDRVVTVGTQREGVVVDTPDPCKVQVRFDDGIEMKVLRDRLYKPGSSPPPPQVHTLWKSLEEYHNYIKSQKTWVRGPVGKHRQVLCALLKLVNNMRGAGVDLEDVAAFFRDSEEIVVAHRIIGLATHVWTFAPGDAPYDHVLQGEANQAVRYLGSLGLAPRDKGGYVGFCAMQKHLTEGSDIRGARIQETRFACRMASRWWMQGRMPSATANRVWVNHVLPFIAIYSLREVIEE